MCRKTKYQEQFIALVRAEKAVGSTNAQIAALLGVNLDTIYEWSKRYPDFSDALETKKAVVIGNLRNSLVRRAMGYEVEETKTIILRTKTGDTIQKVEKIRRHIPPSDVALIVALSNWDPEHIQRHPGGGETSKGAIAEFMADLKKKKRNGTG